MPDVSARFSYVDTPYGQVHLADAAPVSGDAASTLVCLHQTPRSCDEYRELVPLLAPHLRVIAMDTLGMGRSAEELRAGWVGYLVLGAILIVTGIAAMINGTVELANSSRPMTEEELEAARANGHDPIEPLGRVEIVHVGRDHANIG